MGKLPENMGKVDVRIVFDDEISACLRKSSTDKVRDIRDQVRFIVKEYYKPQPKDQENDANS